MDKWKAESSILFSKEYGAMRHRGEVYAGETRLVLAVQWIRPKGINTYYYVYEVPTEETYCVKRAWEGEIETLAHGIYRDEVWTLLKNILVIYFTMPYFYNMGNWQCSNDFMDEWLQFKLDMRLR